MGNAAEKAYFKKLIRISNEICSTYQGAVILARIYPGEKRSQDVSRIRPKVRELEAAMIE